MPSKYELSEAIRLQSTQIEYLERKINKLDARQDFLSRTLGESNEAILQNQFNSNTVLGISLFITFFTFLLWNTFLISKINRLKRSLEAKNQ